MAPPPQDPLLSRCPKCNATMTTSADAYGPYLRCYQCGKTIDLIVQHGTLVPRPPSDPMPTPEPDLPDNVIYTCNEAPTCTQCPLPFCKYEVTGYDLARATRQRRDHILETMERENLTAPQAAKRFNLNTRTIFRMKARARAQPPEEPP